MDQAQSCDLLIAQVDLFSQRGEMPRTLFEAAEREKDIRFSSRTRTVTDLNLRLHRIKAVIRCCRASVRS